MENKEEKPLTPQEFTRLAANFYTQNDLPFDYNRLAIDSQLCNYIATRQADVEKKYKVALVCICLNPPYWEFAYDMMEGARQFFLPGHKVDFHFWTDIPENTEDMRNKIRERLKAQNTKITSEVKAEIEKTIHKVSQIKKIGANLYPTEAVEWPMPTLMRYSLFLQQEEVLKDYDYVFYCDIDMKFVNVVGDEILGKGLTAAQHPMYALDKKFWPPYEPNKDSESYIPRPGRVVVLDGQKRFMPLYFAGGFQGGETKQWISAMKDMKKMIDKDFTKNYIPIWNDETAWNKYLFLNPPEIVLTPSYIYPDSLIKEYYEKIWGCNYLPRLVTLTKKFSTTSEGAQEANKMMEQLKGL